MEMIGSCIILKAFTTALGCGYILALLCCCVTRGQKLGHAYCRISVGVKPDANTRPNTLLYASEKRLRREFKNRGSACGRKEGRKETAGAGREAPFPFLFCFVSPAAQGAKPAFVLWQGGYITYDRCLVACTKKPS